MPFLAIAWSFLQRGVSGLLTFCSKPPGSWIAAAVALALGLWWFGQHEFNRGVLKCEAAHAEAAAQERARVISAISAVNNRSILRTTVSEKKNTDNQKRVAHVKEQAAAMPGASDVCVSADVADGVRDIQ